MTGHKDRLVSSVMFVLCLLCDVNFATKSSAQSTNAIQPLSSTLPLTGRGAPSGVRERGFSLNKSFNS